MNNLIYLGQKTIATNDSYNHEIEDYETFDIFSCTKSIKDIMLLHINSNYPNSFGIVTANNFVFPTNFEYINEYYLFCGILSSFEETIKGYFKKASFIENNTIIDGLRIQFEGEDDYLLLNEAIKLCQNIFLTFLQIEKKVDFARNTIFQCNYNAIPYDFVKEQELKNCNFFAFFYFIHIDLNMLKIEDLDFVIQDKFTKNLNINPYVMHKTDIEKEISDIFYLIPSGIKKNRGKNIDVLERYHRIFDLYSYQYYLSKKATYHNCIVWLMKKGYKFSEHDTSSTMSNTADTSQYNTYIKEDKKTIANIKKLAENIFVF
jgi:hypothetical protein